MLLLGVNCGAAMSTRPYGSRHPYVHHTALGWCLVGPVCLDSSLETSTSLRTFRTSTTCKHYSAEQNFDNKLPADLIPRNFNAFMEARDDDQPGISKEDQEFSDIMDAGISVNKAGNFEIPLPFKKNTILPDNRGAVFLRTKNTLRRIQNNPAVANQCAEAMGKYITAGHVEKLPPHEENKKGLVYYINVFPVFQEKKPGKARMCFDRSASFRGQSLNDRLLRGPDVTNRLIGVLLRFREKKVAFVADVECMFHAFYVTPEHRDALRFYWWSDNTPSDKLSPYRAKVHIFGNRSSLAVTTHGLRHAASHPDVAPLVEARSFINDNFYVDDGLGSAATATEAIKILTDARTILSRFNIRLHKIVSPDTRVLQAFPSSDLAPELDSINISKSSSQTALGVVWKIDSDTFCLNHPKTKKDFTKRGILSVNGSIFDPLGIASPVSLGGRILQRKFITPKPPLDTKCYDWDDPLPVEYLYEWRSWLSQLETISRLVIPRHFSWPDDAGVKSLELHVFADASVEAVGHVIYLRVCSRTGTVHISFLFGNSKVAPRSATSIPRLELCAALEAAQSARYVASEMRLKIDNVFFCSDSKIVLGYLTNTERSFTKYVTTRVGQILKTTSPSQWTYVSSRENPADLATHPCTPAELEKSRWFKGPEFLTRTRPVCLDDDGETMDLPETIQTPKVLTVKTGQQNYVSTSVIARTNSWASAVKIMSLVLIFVDRCRKRPVCEVASKSGAVNFLVREAQKEAFSSDFGLLQSGKELPTSSSLLKLTPFVDDCGIVRVGGRFRNADYPVDEKHPRLLPPHHRITTLIIGYCHDKSYHQGRFITAAYLRNHGYHIIRQGKTVSKFISDCLICKKLRHAPKPQLMADLPTDRLSEAPPFAHSGVDVFGPYFVHDGQTTRRTSASKKIWVLLLTCLFSRAVHVEMLNSLDISSLKHALRRFTAIRGDCVMYRSDCGTNFVGATNLSEKESWGEVLRNCDEFGGDVSSDPVWKFLPPHASHFAGVWERKVGSIKNILDVSLSLLGSRRLGREELWTLLQEAAAIVNKTPLGDISADPNDPYPVSPAALLTLRGSGSTDPPSFFPEGDLLSYGKRRWKRVQYLADQFWVRWKRDYLKTLQVRRKWQRRTRNVVVGDVVIVKENSPRNSWPMGIVTDTKFNSDGLVRSTTIRLKPSPSGSVEFGKDNPNSGMVNPLNCKQYKIQSLQRGIKYYIKISDSI